MADLSSSGRRGTVRAKDGTTVSQADSSELS